jgi:hypothetical protein
MLRYSLEKLEMVRPLRNYNVCQLYCAFSDNEQAGGETPILQLGDGLCNGRSPQREHRDSGNFKEQN